MPRVTTLVCDFQGTNLFVFSDDLAIFSDTKPSFLHEIFVESSHLKLNNILENTRNNLMVDNSTLVLLWLSDTQEVYLSTLKWMEKIILRISDEPLKEFFFDFRDKKQALQPFIFPCDDVMDETKLEDYSRLNNELTTIQRELQKRTIKLETLNQKLELLATTDSMTGLLNRRAILELARKEMERSSREKKSFGLALMDLDNLKEINDTFGHHMGDRALNSLSDILTFSIRGYDSAGRIGGDEFMLYFSLDSEKQFHSILKRLLESLRSVEIETNTQESIKPRASIGGVYYSSQKNEDISVKDLLIQADKALYESKNSGGDQITIKEFVS